MIMSSWPPRTSSLSWAFAGRLGSSAVLADQPGDGLSTVDPAVMLIMSLGSCRRRAERMALMWAVLVEVAFVLGQDRSQVPLTIDEQMIEALAA